MFTSRHLRRKLDDGEDVKLIQTMRVSVLFYAQGRRWR